MYVEVRQATNLVGVGELTDIDEGMGMARGTFTPKPFYEGLRPVFAIFAEAAETKNSATLSEYFRQRDDLGLSLHDSDGSLIPTFTIQIVDYEVELSFMELEVSFATPEVTRMVGEVLRASRNTKS